MEQHQPDGNDQTDDINFDDAEGYWETDEEDDDDDFEISFQSTDHEFENDQIVTSLSKFYAMLEGKLFIPSTSVQKISKYLTFLSEVLQVKLKARLLKHLKDLKIDDNDILLVLNDILTNDVLYNTHHKGVY